MSSVTVARSKHSLHWVQSALCARARQSRTDEVLRAWTGATHQCVNGGIYSRHVL